MKRGDRVRAAGIGRIERVLAVRFGYPGVGWVLVTGELEVAYALSENPHPGPLPKWEREYRELRDF